MFGPLSQPTCGLAAILEAANDRAEEPIHGRRGTIRGTYNPRLRRFYSLRRPPMKAHELLNSAEAWCQESPAEDRQGNKLQALDPRAVKWCVLSAIQRAYPVSQWGEAMDRLLRALSVS